MHSVNPEINALREEITRLRERIAVLEAAPKYPYPVMPPPNWATPVGPTWTNPIWCGAVAYSTPNAQ